MTAEIENLVLEQLRAIRGELSDIKERMGRVELRLSGIEQTLDGALVDSDREAGQWFIKRMEHINGAWG